MAEFSTTLKADKRSEAGKRRVRRMRQSGLVPAVVYGHKEATIPVQVGHDDFWAMLRHNTRVVDLQLDGKLEKCLIKSIQWDVLGKEVVHVDFTRVSADERIRVSVPIQIRGTAPGVAAGGIVDQMMHSIEIECLAISVPEAIRVNVHDLQLEAAIHLKEVKLPEGVKAFGEPEAIVVQCVKPKEEAEAPAEGAAAEGPAEPEVIGRKAAEETTEEAE